MRKMITASLLTFGTLAFAACGGGAPNPYPAGAQAQFHASCPANDPVCTCEWDQITRTLTYEQYNAAIETFRSEGTMDPHITRAKTHCLEWHPHH